VTPNGDGLMRQLEGVESLVGHSMGKRPRSDPSINEEQGIWKKQSIFFRLPYWRHNLLRHNLDVMHIEKNVVDNILGTLLDMKGKTKDNYEARIDI
jgi:hypothetical protein